MDRTGKRYRPSVVSGYERDLRGRIVPVFGTTRIGRLTRLDVQRWVDSLAYEALAASTHQERDQPA